MKALIAIICAFFLTASAIGMIRTEDGSIILSPTEAAGLANEIKDMQREIHELRAALGYAEGQINRCKEIKT